MREARFVVHGSQQRLRDLIAGFRISRMLPESVTVSSARHFHEHSSMETQPPDAHCHLVSVVNRSQSPSRFRPRHRRNSVPIVAVAIWVTMRSSPLLFAITTTISAEKTKSLCRRRDIIWQKTSSPGSCGRRPS
ncbi:hypothetical protein TIFTF001_039372 [Ficus carica]|uniref:Uncharacterized protein n=1 Tax=Ficus carica TaxID=3494 RepID=A0AA88E909_FICCA|nr:hypothetical protein TIFTF001_039372 [Ficus carica]